MNFSRATSRVFLVAPGLWHAPQVAEGFRDIGIEAIIVGAGLRHPILKTPLRLSRALASRSPAAAPLIHFALGAACAFVSRPRRHDLVICWSSFAAGYGLFATNAPLVVVRGSHHIRRQAMLLAGAPRRDRPSLAMVKLEEAEYRQASAITVPTREIAADQMWAMTKAARVVVAPYGFPRVETRVPHRHSRAARLLFGGEFGYRKGADILLTALRSKPAAVESFRIFGRLGYRGDVLPEWWDHVGLRPASEWLDALRQSDALLLPSREEGTARVGLEAIANGVPVIATPEAGLSQWLRQGAGIEIPAAEWPFKLSAALDRVVRERAEFSARCFATAAAWSWTDHVEALLDGLELAETEVGR